MNSVANSNRREIHAEIPLPLFNWVEDFGGPRRSHGHITNTVVAALEDYRLKIEKSRTTAVAGDNQDGTSWLDQLMEDTTRKKRGK